MERVVDALERPHRTVPPVSLGPIRREQLEGWPAVARKPEAFLSLGLVSKDWLNRALPTLLQSETAAFLEGSELLHLDMRSDNICLLPDRVVFVDWNNACLGNGLFDIAAWLPSLHAEGGPTPMEHVARSSGIRQRSVGLFRGPGRTLAAQGLCAPEVRTVQRHQLRTPALHWAIRELALPMPSL